MHNLANYMHVTARVPENRFGGNVELKPYSLGMGSIGLPGDLSSASRFVRAAFTRANSVTDGSEADNISQFFHILDSVAQTRGLTTVRPGEFEITRYSSCCNASRGIYYYTTYGNRQITALDMHSRDLNGEKIYSYPISDTQQIKFL
jgi:choloylglycine hydrolase